MYMHIRVYIYTYIESVHSAPKLSDAEIGRSDIYIYICISIYLYLSIYIYYTCAYVYIYIYIYIYTYNENVLFAPALSDAG